MFFLGWPDTNVAIVGAVIGPLIGYKNFDEEFLKMLSLVPKNRFVFNSALMIIYAYFLKNNMNNTDHLKGKYFIRTLLYLLNEQIDLNDILNNGKANKKNKENKEKNNNEKKDGINNEKVDGQNKNGKK